MKKLRGSLAAKVIAFILLAISILYIIAGTFASAAMYSLNFYEEDKSSVLLENIEQLMKDKSCEALYGYYTAVRNNQDYEKDILVERYCDIFSEKNSNFFFIIKDKDGNELLNNYYDEAFRYKLKEDYEYDGESRYVTRYEKFSSYEDMAKFDPYGYYEDNFDITGCFPVKDEASGVYYYEIKGYLNFKEVITVEGYLKNEFSAKDSFYWCEFMVSTFYDLRIVIPFCVAAAVLIFISMLTFLVSAAGYRKGKEGIYLNPFDKIPLDLFSLIMIVGGVFTAAFLIDCLEGYVDWAYLAAVFVYLICLVVFIITLAVRIKRRKWWENTVVYYLFRVIIKILSKIRRREKYILENIPMLWKTALFYLMIVITEGVVLILFGGSPGILLLLWLIEKAVLAPIIFILVINMKTLQKGGQQLAEGNLEHKIDLRHMLWDFKKHGENLNSINKGMSNAVEEKMKSERFKTELITNVSHDIKTPLTSIVNYVDLLKKEDIQSENAVRYIEVLERQSGRLKKLIEDLVEASKASTGNIAINLSRVDVNVLLTQTIGEYVEKLAAEDIRLVADYASQPVYINADGRLMWRVLDNLMNNISKYTQSGTRVYVSTGHHSEDVVITFRNVSKYELNISAEELMERFVRGDSSRNTEGSGLGLSIARSLVEHQGGKMDLSIDGDLFKVKLMFKAIK